MANLKISVIFLFTGLDCVLCGSRYYCQLVDRIDCQQRQEAKTCGSNGKTYYNMCALLVANCADSRLMAVHPGPCAQTTPRPGLQITNSVGQLAYDIFCLDLSHHRCPPGKSFEVHEICASNNVTYRNLCEFDKARCTNRHMHVVKYEACS